jgi:hypothetical protein
MLLDGVLIPVNCLTNETTIVQVPVEEVTYYHVELPSHGVLLAEGLPVGSYLDSGDRGELSTGAPAFRSVPDGNARNWESGGCAAQVVTGAKLDAARQWVNARAMAVA